MIRRYHPSDRPALLDALRANTPAYFAPEEIADFEAYLDHYEEQYHVVEENGKVIGGSGYNILPELGEGRISWIFFHPEHSGKGHGRRLVNHVLNILRTDERVEKLVVRTSQLVYPFFETFGFRLTDVQKDYWAPGLDLYFMEMPKGTP